jgi:hypothetical protein
MFFSWITQCLLILFLNLGGRLTSARETHSADLCWQRAMLPMAVPNLAASVKRMRPVLCCAVDSTWSKRGVINSIGFDK